MYWLEYRDERKLMGPNPPPVFCGVWTSDLIVRRFLPWWASPSTNDRAFGSLKWFGKYGEGWYWYRLDDNMTWYWPGIKVDVPCGNLINRGDMINTLDKVMKIQEQIAEEEQAEAALVTSWAALYDEDHPFYDEDDYFDLPVFSSY